MLKLRTEYPKSLNDFIGDEYKKMDVHVLVDKRFLPLSRKHDRVSRGKNHKNNNSFSPKEFLIKDTMDAYFCYRHTFI